jgi:hypothetical protein
MSQFVALNVGGVLHHTTRETLTREPSSRLALVARGVLPCAAAPDGALLIDRSPRFFQTSECRLRCSSPSGVLAEGLTYAHDTPTHARTHATRTC